MGARHDELAVSALRSERHYDPIGQNIGSMEAEMLATFSNPAYWRGAMQTRQALGDAGRGLLLCVQIERDLIAGKGLSDSSAFREWREGVR